MEASAKPNQCVLEDLVDGILGASSRSIKMATNKKGPEGRRSCHPCRRERQKEWLAHGSSPFYRRKWQPRSTSKGQKERRKDFAERQDQARASGNRRQKEGQCSISANFNIRVKSFYHSISFLKVQEPRSLCFIMCSLLVLYFSIIRCVHSFALTSPITSTFIVISLLVLLAIFLFVFLFQ